MTRGAKGPMAEATIPPGTQRPPRAGGFIVTVYGDLVEPRGGVLWMGTLIDLCGAVGLSESLVRTAVSRLVAAGQLTGERLGRRSYYRLTPAAQREYADAARIIFSPSGAGARGWIWLVDPRAPEALMRAGFAEAGPGLWLGPDRGGDAPVAAAVMRAGPGQGDWAAMAARLWPMADHAAAYRRVLARFGGLDPALPGPEQALTLRLSLVHAYRSALLRDPRLPAEALPDDWPGAAARELFARLYTGLTPAAEAHVARACITDRGPMEASTAATRARAQALGLPGAGPRKDRAPAEGGGP